MMNLHSGDSLERCCTGLPMGVSHPQRISRSERQSGHSLFATGKSVDIVLAFEKESPHDSSVCEAILCIEESTPMFTEAISAILDQKIRISHKEY